jgi:predicted alpha/beta superfamily hydrolase
VTNCSTPTTTADAWLPFQRAGASQIDLTSKDGRGYRIFVSVPDSAPPPGGFPVLYLLDGNATFATAMDAVAMQMRRPHATGVPPGIVVGIGYPGDAPLAPERRWFDLTPASDSAGPSEGGAAAFADFIADTVKPLVQSSWPVDPGRQAVFGHSLGGLFVLWSLFARPESFQSHVAASPSIWWNDCAILAQADDFIRARGCVAAKGRLLMTVGSLERTPPSAMDRGSTTMMENVKALAAQLRGKAADVLDVSYAEFADENHVSVIPAAISRGVRFAWQKP